VAASPSLASSLSIGSPTKDLTGNTNNQTRLIRLASVDPGASQKQMLTQAVVGDSTVAVSYDPSSGLVSKSDYEAPTGAGLSRIHVSVEYGDYRDEGGYNLPHHLVRSLQYSPELDLTIATVNISAQ
jgi:hypothetical protein